jgi:valyl-tRNA synthetase
MRNIQDWCISRQLWWGHRIPAWYDDAGTTYVARSEDEAQAQATAKHGKAVALRQDEDVLDTWFSSALWPFSTLDWPETTAPLQQFYPTNVLVTGFDIIFFWVARMIMLGLKFMGEVPFREVYVHGLIRDGEGQKMSKSKGNVIDPLDIVDGIELEALVKKRTTGLMQPHLAPAIERATRKQFPEGIANYGTDALRFTFASLATQSRDLRFDLVRVGGYRNFCNKLWNASRFFLMNWEQYRGDVQPGALLTVATADSWIRSRLGKTITAVEKAFADYRLDYAATALYEFVWHDLCDWYLEMAKPVMQGSDAAARAGTLSAMHEVFETTLRVLHPIMPFITEEIWQRMNENAGTQGAASIMLADWPRATSFRPLTAEEEAGIEWLKQVVLGVRQIRGEMDISPAHKLPLLLAQASPLDGELAARHSALLLRLAGLASVRVLPAAEPPPPSAAAVVGELTLLVPMAGLIDPAAEVERLGKRCAKTRQELTRASAKLGNDSFVRSAPEAVVQQERQRLADFERTLASLERQLQAVQLLATG